MINGDLVNVQLTVGPQTHPVVISSVPGCIIGIDTLRRKRRRGKGGRRGGGEEEKEEEEYTISKVKNPTTAV